MMLYGHISAHNNANEGWMFTLRDLHRDINITGWRLHRILTLKWPN